MATLNPRNLFLAVLVTSGLWCNNAAPAAERSKKFAIVELFTSEGCSSCPSADEALSDLIRDRKGSAVYALAFHVDYWNSLGWTDPFAAPVFSDRQRKYAAVMHADSVYTPQAIVNGAVQFNGSDRAALKEAVDSALAAPANGSLTGSISHDLETTIVNVTCKDIPRGSVIFAVLVERHLSMEVKRGENGGRTLKHDNLARAFASVALDASGNATVRLIPPKAVHRENTSIIIFAQRPADMHILAATTMPLDQ